LIVSASGWISLESLGGYHRNIKTTELINSCYEEAKELLNEKKLLLEKMATLLLEKEVINYEEIKQILGNNYKTGE